VKRRTSYEAPDHTVLSSLSLMFKHSPQHRSQTLSTYEAMMNI